MKYLLDTAPWINGVTLPQALPLRIRRLLGGSDKKGLCSLSLLETAILHRLGRLKFNGTLKHFFEVGLSDDLHLIELSPAITARTNDFSSDFPGDPFDRTIVATALVLNLTLITADPVIRDAGKCAIEYYPFKPSSAQ